MDKLICSPFGLLYKLFSYWYLSFYSESKEKAFYGLERVRSNASEGDLAPFDMEKIVCGICLKLLKRKPSSSLANIMPTIYNSVVAVLACAHVYHADCLEQRTSEADRWDPPCPMCTNKL